MSTISIAASHAAIKGRHYPYHMHASWELIYYRSGHIQCVLEVQGESKTERTIESRPGMVLIIPPQIMHRDYVCTDFSQYYLRLYRRPPLRPWSEIIYDDSDGTIRQLFGTLVR